MQRESDFVEVWKCLQPWSYEVSNLGRVRNWRTGRILKPWASPARNGSYLKVGLWRYGRRRVFFVHRLVALAFIPNPQGKPEVNHFDEDTTNNRESNLSWMTRHEQEAHKQFMRG